MVPFTRSINFKLSFFPPIFPTLGDVAPPGFLALVPDPSQNHFTFVDVGINTRTHNSHLPTLCLTWNGIPSFVKPSIHDLISMWKMFMLTHIYSLWETKNNSWFPRTPLTTDSHFCTMLKSHPKNISHQLLSPGKKHIYMWNGADVTISGCP